MSWLEKRKSLWCNDEHVEIVKRVKPLMGDGGDKRDKLAIVIWRNTHPGERLALGGADLQDLDLRDADLQGANLSRANLKGSILRDAILRGANLQNTNLEDVDLRGADLLGANLRGAYLKGVFLQDAYMKGATLQGVNLHAAQSIIVATGYDDEFWGIEHDDGLRIKSGSGNWFTVPEAYERYSRDNEYDKLSRAAVDALVSQAKARGWVIGEPTGLAWWEYWRRRQH